MKPLLAAALFACASCGEDPKVEIVTTTFDVYDCIDRGGIIELTPERDGVQCLVIEQP